MQTFQTIAFLLAVTPFSTAQAIDPESVELSTRDQWCQSQIAECPTICQQEEATEGEPQSNDCDAETLAYSCVCSNGAAPNASQYTETLPYFICTESNNQCVANCNTNAVCATECRTRNLCGAQDPERAKSSSTKSSSPTSTKNGAGASTASDGSVIYTGLGGDSAATTPASKENAADMIVNAGQSYGLAVILASFLAGFGLIL